MHSCEQTRLSAACVDSLLKGAEISAAGPQANCHYVGRSGCRTPLRCTRNGASLTLFSCPPAVERELCCQWATKWPPLYARSGATLLKLACRGQLLNSANLQMRDVMRRQSCACRATCRTVAQAPQPTSHFELNLFVRMQQANVIHTCVTLTHWPRLASQLPAAGC